MPTDPDRALTLNLALENVDMLDERRTGGRTRVQLLAHFTRPQAERLLQQLADALGVDVPPTPDPRDHHTTPTPPNQHRNTP